MEAIVMITQIEELREQKKHITKTQAAESRMPQTETGATAAFRK